MNTTILIDPVKCTGCGICVQSCPVDVLRTDAVTGKAIALYPGDCHVCFLCEDDCPSGAIVIDPVNANPRRRSIYGDGVDIGDLSSRPK